MRSKDNCWRSSMAEISISAYTALSITTEFFFFFMKFLLFSSESQNRLDSSLSLVAGVNEPADQLNLACERQLHLAAAFGVRLVSYTSGIAFYFPYCPVWPEEEHRDCLCPSTCFLSCFNTTSARFASKVNISRWLGLLSWKLAHIMQQYDVYFETQVRVGSSEIDDKGTTTWHCPLCAYLASICSPRSLLLIGRYPRNNYRTWSIGASCGTLLIWKMQY